MTIQHISDSHNQHAFIETSPVDVLLFTGDLGGRTTLPELTSFLTWFESQPSKIKIFCAGNHDICLDPSWDLRVGQNYEDVLKLVANYKVTYLCDEEYVYEGVKFYGSPYTPSFFRNNWAWNADRGSEIQAVWAKIPSDTDILITHGPPYGIMDLAPVPTNGDHHVGCKDLLSVIEKLPNLKLSCFGHIHANTGLLLKQIDGKSVWFSNGAVVDNQYQLVMSKPPIINI